MRTRVKICGINRVDDALGAAAAGADALGLVFYSPSPRYVTPAQAREICLAVPPFVTMVGLFVEPEREQVAEILQCVGLNYLQFHGSESAEFCNSFEIPYIKGVRMMDRADITEEEQHYHSAKALLIDSFDAALAGGSGRGFAWNRIPTKRIKPLVLAGGLSADNVAHAISTVRPYAVDVSSGVESTRGHKDIGKIKRFVEAVAEADCAVGTPASNHQQRRTH